MTIKIHIAHFDGIDKERIQQIRYSVFSQEQKIDAAIDLDGQDPGAVHVLAKVDQVFAGTGRMLGDGHIGRLAVLKSARGKDVGKKLVQKLVEIAGERGMERVFLGSQEHAVGFYRKLGFIEYGAAYEEAGILHVHMEKMIPRSNQVAI
jgi:predicted GNAT family N-acyltransferase